MSTDLFKDYSRVVWARLPWLLVISLIVAAIAYVAAIRLPLTQQVHFSYLIALADREPSSQYRFDGYYALQATDLFSATVTAWVHTPEVIIAAYQAAQLPVPSSDPRVLLQKISAEKTAPQLVHIVVRDSDPLVAEKLAQGLQVAMQQQLQVYHQEGTPALTFKLVPTTTWRGVERVDVRLVTITTFVVALFIGLNLILLRESWRSR